MPAILDIWESNSKRGRYTSKWKQGPWPDTLDEMARLENEWKVEMGSRVTYSIHDAKAIVDGML